MGRNRRRLPIARITKIQARRGTASAWTSANPTLAAGEPGYETDTGKWKVGDGSTAWTSLPYDRDLAAHLADTSDAHDASAISADSTTLVGTGTDVQAVLEELDNGIADHLADTSAAHAATAIAFTPSGTIAASTVQAAIEEVAAEAVAAPGSSVLLYDYTVAGTDKASIDTFVEDGGAGTSVNLSGAYRVLEIWLVARTDEAATVDVALDIVLNNDASSIYDNQALAGGNTTASAGVSVAQASWAINSHGAGGTGSYPTVHRITIPAYAGTTFNKVGEHTSARPDGTAGNNRVDVRSLGYRSTSAITRLKVAARTTNKLKVGSRLIIFAR